MWGGLPGPIFWSDINLTLSKGHVSSLSKGREIFGAILRNKWIRDPAMVVTVKGKVFSLGKMFIWNLKTILRYWKHVYFLTGTSQCAFCSKRSTIFVIYIFFTYQLKCFWPFHQVRNKIFCTSMHDKKLISCSTRVPSDAWGVAERLPYVG